MLFYSYSITNLCNFLRHTTISPFIASCFAVLYQSAFSTAYVLGGLKRCLGVFQSLMPTIIIFKGFFHDQCPTLPPNLIKISSELLSKKTKINKATNQPMDAGKNRLFGRDNERSKGVINTGKRNNASFVTATCL